MDHHIFIPFTFALMKPRMPGRNISHYLFVCVFVVVFYSRRVAVLHIYYYLNAGLSAQNSSKVLKKALVTEKEINGEMNRREMKITAIK